MASLIGRTLGRYQILDEISRGGMGIVYRALDLRLNREVALKVLPPELVANADRRARFVQEARAASAVEHPHIAVIHEIDEADGISYIAMELLRGEKLSDLTLRGPLPALRALEIATEIAEGLARAHEKGIVHRDLKPSNVIVTDDGHAKIIDFGLAKLVESLSGEPDGVTIAKAETHPGTVLGTASYMSPEQARGGKVDHRSDIFSFGVLLHEMLTGHPPFRGDTGVDTMHAILHDPAPPLPPLGPTVTAEATADVQRLLDKCLGKEPEARYQGMRDVVVDLRAARRRLESSGVSPIVAAARKGTTREGIQNAQAWAYGGVALLVLALAAFGFLKQRWTGTTAPASSGKPSVAVLYFENNTGNPQLDWLRTGLTDMLVTDLSQSPDVEVLGTDRLVQILTAMRRQDDRAVSFDTVQELAKRAGVTSVLLGSYMKSGETIRINIKLQDAATGRIVTSERVEAASETHLFPTVDDLTRRIKAKFALGPASDPTRPLLTRPDNAGRVAAAPLDRDLKDVTTSSIEAYRYYAEGINLHERARESDAVAPLEKAIAVDAGFAMALAKLAVVHNNLNHPTVSEDFARRAFEHRDRISARERHYIEGLYYSLRLDGYQQSIDAYKTAVQMFPDHSSARHNLALQYERLERFEEAAAEYDELRRRDNSVTFTTTNLAFNLVRLGQFDRAYELSRDLIGRYPDNAAANFSLGGTLLAWGKLDDALAPFMRAEALDPTEFRAVSSRRAIAVLRERWAEADALAQKLRASTDPAVRFTGTANLAHNRLYGGQSAEGLRLLSTETAHPSPQSASSRNDSAVVLLARNQPGQALVEARRALADARGIGPTPLTSLFLIGAAQGALGNTSDSRKTGEELDRLVGLLPSERLKRWSSHYAGRMALIAGDHERAIQDLLGAEARLAPVPFSPAVHNESIALWFDLGTAFMAGGRPKDAVPRFRRIVDAGMPRLWNPIEFVRSLYALGQSYEQLGDRPKALEFYRRFVDYWGDGDIDRERVAEARKKLAGS